MLRLFLKAGEVSLQQFWFAPSDSRGSSIWWSSALAKSSSSWIRVPGIEKEAEKKHFIQKGLYKIFSLRYQFLPKGLSNSV
jgi:hypothetical protein